MKAMRGFVGATVLTMFVSANAAPQQPHSSFQHRHVSAQAAWQQGTHAVPGANAADLRRRAIAQKLQMRPARSMSSIGVGTGWTSLGPSPLPSDASGIGLQDYSWIAGRATAVAIDPNDAGGNTVFIGGANGGVWKSVNAGALSPNASAVTWTSLTDDEPTLAIGALAVQSQPANPDPSKSVVLAGTGETNSSADSYYGLGILRSADGGQTWTLIPQDATGAHSFAGIGFSRFAFSSADPNFLVAGTASTSEGILEALENPVAINRGIYYSSDAGASWNQASITDSGSAISAASVTSVAYNAPAGKFYAAVRFHGFYASLDGVNWLRLAAQPGTGLSSTACPTQASQPSGCPIYRGEIAIVPNRAGSSGAGEMYVWYVDANNVDQGIWQSLNGGFSWTQINDSGITNCGDLFGGCGTDAASDNLALAAVANGSVTDLYAGATNIFKCTITNASPICSGTSKNTFVNLTHVYGCSDIAKVYPGQHAIDFLVSGGTSLLYFANDGGIYRALDGFTGLTTGTCGLTNQFDSLNASLGAMTQFVSLAHSSTDPNLMFGGTATTGAAATAFSQSGGNWVNVNAGDIGATAINPANENEWFLSASPDSVSGVNLLRCANGVNCHTQDFASDQIADSNALGGDTGGFHLPFILDPANPAMLLIGTCKIWRGASTGGPFSLLSPDFETGGTGVCSGSETNVVRTIAAGGPVDSVSNSQVIYAGTNGYGPLIGASPHGGRVWVTTNSDADLGSWADRTGPINPQAYPISSIAIDPADPSGQTAYVGIMGFHTSHVWKTTNAGVSWTDFTGNLADAPVNSVVIDPGNTPGSGSIYIGTDIGVFASSTAAPSWTEVGPMSGPGFLPELAVTSLKMFNSGGVKRLRAATYGRGIWEWNLITTPDFQIAIVNNPQTIFAGQTAIYNGTIFARNGYNSSVDLSCAAGGTGAPQNCAANPLSVSPNPQGVPFTVNAGGTAGDYFFNLHARGTDTQSITHDSPLSLHVVDFNLSPPVPGTITVLPHGTSGPAGFIVSAAGSFTSQVSLACLGLPSGSACNFQPANVVNPTSGNPVPVTVTVTTSVNTPIGTSQIAINATTQGGPARSQMISLKVNSAPDYVLSISNPSLTTQVNTPAMFSGMLTTVNGYNSSVALSCGGLSPPTCVASPASAVPSSSGTPFTLTVNSAVSQAFAFNVDAIGSDASAIAHSVPVTFTALPAQGFDFTLSSPTPPNVSVAAGQAATYSFNLAPVTGTFPGTVTFTCSGLPALTTCNFTPSQIAAGSGGANVTITAVTTPAIPAARIGPALWMAFPIVGMLLIWSRAPQRRRISGALIIVLGIALSNVSCGGGLQGNSIGSGSPGTPAGTYNIIISVSTASVTHSTQASLTITP